MSCGYPAPLRGLAFSPAPPPLHGRSPPSSFHHHSHLLHHLVQETLPTTYLLSPPLPRPLLTSAVRASCGDEREVDAHSEARPALNGRVLIGPRPRLGTSGCPRVEFPPWRLLLPPVVRPDNRLGLSDPRPPTDLLGLRELWVELVL